MPVLLRIFLMFAKLSTFAFGGGYVMFPMLMKEIEGNKLLTMPDVADVIAIAGMSPGAVAINAAVGVGFKVAGIPGVIVSLLGIAMPCAIIVILAATFFFKVYNHHLVKAALYGLRPVITGIILFAAIKIALTNSIISIASDTQIQNGFYLSFKGIPLFEAKSIIIALSAFFIFTKTKVHPVFVIIAAGILGGFIF